MLAILDKPEMRLHALPLSVKVYEKMGELGLVDEATELIRGVIFEKMSKSPLHSGLIRRFVRRVNDVLDTGSFVSSEQPLRLTDSCPEPDLAVIQGDEREFMKNHPTTARFIVEISISSEAVDREKAAIYAEAGVLEYWIVLPGRGVIEQFSEVTTGGYGQHGVVPAGEVCTSREFPALQVRLADWLE